MIILSLSDDMVFDFCYPRFFFENGLKRGLLHAELKALSNGFISNLNGTPNSTGRKIVATLSVFIFFNFFPNKSKSILHFCRID